MPMMRNADVWNAETLFATFSLQMHFQRKGVNVSTHQKKKNETARANLLNVHSDSFEWRDVEILSPSVRDRALFFLPLYVCSFLAVCIGRDKGTISSPSIHRILFAFDAFVNNTITKQTLTLSLPFVFHVFF